MYQSVRSKVGPSENVVISPFSVASVLVMTHVGAKGITANQLKDILDLSHFPDEKICEVFGDFIRDLRVKTHIQSYALVVLNTFLSLPYKPPCHYDSVIMIYFME